MANFNYYLKTKELKKEAPIRLHITYNSKECKVYTGLKSNSKHWNSRTQEVKHQVIQSTEKNKRLRQFKQQAENTYLQLVNEKVEITNSLLKERIYEIIEPKKTYNFFEFFEEYITNQKELAKSTLTDYNQTLSTIRLFEKEVKYKVLFSSITLEFYDKLKGFIMDKQGYSVNTFGKRIKVLKTIMRASKDREMHNNTDYDKRDFKVLSKTYKKPYLRLEEIDLIYKCDLNKKHDKYRDMFLLLCNLGIRISDLPQINKGNIARIKGTNTLSIKMRKTNKQVTIPINPIAMQIIEKYNYELPSVSEQTLNKEIKNICKIAGLDREFKNEKGKFKLHDIVTSHDGRRSFATNCYLNGIPASQIMEITGHKTESSFLRYIQETRTPQAPEIFKVFEGITLK